ncbi:hypothetical protein LJ737_14870 [Hymenobacter sp. 15J16-1T3B]|uniref:hypothetical protein n=1 Tax=Hymenobacter sp. 15J16-1T3B TaxID=2886941 RepID=UPI001D110339|nr:hypothetical protein [Hymenobacter sp. 15J16-1T3B]MCC3158530.1 hypothetical protein [Hymenobacter sp. 15J16-1T3B]
MVILIKRFGQLGNRLFLFAHLVANAAEHGYALANPSFNGYARYFQAPATGDFGGLPIRVNVLLGSRSERWLERLFNLVQRPAVFGALHRLRRQLPAPALPELLYLDDDHGYDLNQPDYLSLARSQKPVLLHGWCFRDRPNLRKHAPLIRELFQLIEPHRTAVAECLSAARRHADVLVGVHIRRSDYATYLDGRYYYDDATYAHFMQAVAAQFPPDRRVAFLVACSEAAPPVEAFPGVQVHFAPGHFVEDMYALAGCDYLMGPPSSYSMWASFYGEVPLLHLETPGQAVPLAAFQVYSDD